eukprot:TRINITY_DN5553_c0_g1_i2.p1 TRINITY_DN5553_c0_g1~~TRINITY_DN5553_c0_g1_i2.p1  ORF type:complete len:547 (+),score=66.97 TRINITY_DN5553_c0_g1_i2:55-1641(+)
MLEFCWCMETVAFVLGAFFVSLHVLVRIDHYRRKLQKVFGASFVKLVRGQVRNALTFVIKFCQEPWSDAVDKEVEEKFNSRRMATTQRVCLAAANCISTCIVFVLWNIAQDRPRWMTIWQFASIICALAVCLCAYAFVALTPRSLDLIYTFLMALTVIFTGCGSSEYFPFTLICSLWARYLFSLVYLKMHSVTFWTVAVTCTSVVYSWQAPPSTIPTSTALGFEVASSIVLLLVVSGVKQWTLTTIHQEIDVSNLKMEKTGAMTLLDMVCDVVVELDKDLAIRRDSRRFAALLLRSSTRSIEGTPFAEFIASEEERDTVLSKLSATAVDSEAFVGTCRAKLLDSLRNPVDMEMFFVKVSLQDGGCHYLLGIREVVDAIPDMPTFQSESVRKQRQDLANRGTPSSLDSGSLESREAPEPPAAQKNSLRFPDLAATHLTAMASDVIMIMSEWNATVPRTFCCNFHAYCKTLHTIERQLLKLQCRPDFPPSAPTGSQCQHCGLFRRFQGDEEPWCTFCQSGDFKLVAPLTL